MNLKQKEYLRVYNLKRYYRLKKEGICTICHKNLSIERKTACTDCSALRRMKSRFTTANKEIYFNLFEIQEGKCRICLNKLLRPALDHCHQTGEVRGLLCPACNTGLGFFKDKPELLISAAEYVKKSRVAVGGEIIMKTEHGVTNIPVKTSKPNKGGWIMED